MKNVLKISGVCFMMLFMVNCSNDDSEGGGNTPSNGWRIGTTNYTTSITQRVATGDVENSIIALDISGGVTNLNSAIVIFSEETGIAAGTYKIITELTGMLPEPDEIMISAGTNYDNNTGVYGTTFYPVEGQNVNATVTITGGKAKIVIPEINITPVPVGSGATATTFAGTIIEQ